MHEIRFSDSIDKVERQFKLWTEDPFLARDRCDRCKEWGDGFYDETHLNFICLKCQAKMLFESMVGKPEQ